MKPESELNKRIATLSPAQRAALMRRLQDIGEVSARDRIPRRNPQQPLCCRLPKKASGFSLPWNRKAEPIIRARPII